MEVGHVAPLPNRGQLADSLYVQNIAPVTVGATSSGTPTPNGIFTSVTVCTPGGLPVGQNPISGPPPAPTCQTIHNILVDTGSVGLRLLAHWTGSTARGH